MGIRAKRLGKFAFVAALCGLLYQPPVFADDLPPHELYGFLLQQGQAEFDRVLGKPLDTGTSEDGMQYRVYPISGASKSYLAVFFNANSEAMRLELTGPDYRGATGFRNLLLGEDASRVRTVLGEPATVKHEPDADVDLWDYPDTNYSLEVSATAKLSSIQLNAEQTRAPGVFAGSADVREYFSAVTSNAVDRLVERSSGRLQCGGTSGVPETSFVRSARADLGDRRSALRSCLEQAARAIATASPNQFDDQMRLSKGAGPLAVTKIGEPSVVKEVVFAWEVGGWRVFEVNFR